MQNIGLKFMFIQSETRNHLLKINKSGQSKYLILINFKILYLSYNIFYINLEYLMLIQNGILLFIKDTRPIKANDQYKGQGLIWPKIIQKQNY